MMNNINSSYRISPNKIENPGKPTIIKAKLIIEEFIQKYLNNDVNNNEKELIWCLPSNAFNLGFSRNRFILGTVLMNSEFKLLEKYEIQSNEEIFENKDLLYSKHFNLDISLEALENSNKILLNEANMTQQFINCKNKIEQDNRSWFEIGASRQPGPLELKTIRTQDWLWSGNFSKQHK